MRVFNKRVLYLLHKPLFMKNILFLITIFLLSIRILSAQTPPARTWYYNDRNIQTTVKERWDENSQGLKHGTYIKYFSNGEREILGYYKNDIPNGQWEITTYSLFQIKSISYTNFVNGQKHGLYKTVCYDVVLMQGNYTNDVKTGFWKENYDIELKIYQEGNYVNGKRDGEWKNTCVLLKSTDELAFGLLLENTSSSNSETKLGYITTYKDGKVLSSVDENGKPATQIKEIKNSNGKVLIRKELIEILDSKNQFYQSYCNNPPFERYKYTEFDNNGMKIIEGEFYTKTNCDIDYRDGQWYFENLSYMDMLKDVKNKLVSFRSSVPAAYWKFPVVKSNVVFENGELVYVGTLQEYNIYKNQRDIAKYNFIKNPTLENLKSYEIIYKSSTHYKVLMELSDILTFKKEVPNGYEFEIPLSKYNSYDSSIYNLYDSILKPYHLNYVFPYVISNRYNYERIDNVFTVYSLPETRLITMVNKRWNIRYFEGDNFSSLKDLYNNEFYVLKDGKQVCKCNEEEPSSLQYRTNSSDIERLKRSEFNKSIFCALRLSQIDGLEWSIEDFLGYMNVFNHIDDVDYKKFLIDRRVNYINTLNQTPNQRDYLILSYLYWLNGNESLSLETFKKAKALPGTFTFKSNKLGSNITFQSVDEFNKYLLNSYISQFGWGITFPNQKEMLKLIKKI